jgi:hypothetical protein
MRIVITYNISNLVRAHACECVKKAKLALKLIMHHMKTYGGV